MIKKIIYSDNLKKISALPELSADELSALERAYIDSIAELGLKHSSCAWWANQLSEKNEHLSRHFILICEYYRLIKLIKNCRAQELAVCGDKLLHRQLKDYCSSENIKLEVPLSFQCRQAVKKVLKNPFNVFRALYYLMVKMMQKICADIHLKKKALNYLKGSKNIYVIRSWINENSFKDPYSDSFFGGLPQHLKQKGFKVVIAAGISGNYLKIIRLLQRNNGQFVVPEEIFLNYRDYFKVAYMRFFRKMRFKERINFLGVDFSVLYRSVFDAGYADVAFCNNLLKYFVGKRLSQKTHLKFFLQTFENYAWEKLMLLGLRENIRNNTRIYGFQHAFITRHSFKYFPGKSESRVMPLPDRIITLGAVTQKILQEYGGYNGLDIKPGCALRQEYLTEAGPFPKPTMRTVLVPLTMNNAESVRIISFLHSSGIGARGYSVVIRPHPFAPFKQFKNMLPFTIPQNFIIRNETTVKEELSGAGIVLYTWSTVALEGLRLGVPVIYLNIAKPMCVDPLFQCMHLKRVVDTPAQLLGAIEQIYSMNENEFLEERLLAGKYLKEYFYPVNPRNMEVFAQG